MLSSTIIQNVYTWVSQNFCNILVDASLQHIYSMMKAVEGTHNGWWYSDS